MYTMIVSPLSSMRRMLLTSSAMFFVLGSMMAVDAAAAASPTTTASSSSPPPYIPFGYQSGGTPGMDGTDHNSYAGSMAIHNHVVVLTGTTYSSTFGLADYESTMTTDQLAAAAAASSSKGGPSSDCFVAMFALPGRSASTSDSDSSSSSSSSPPATLELESQKRFGSRGDVSQACSQLVIHKGSHLLALGHSPPEGVLTQHTNLHHHMENMGSPLMFGTLMEMGVSDQIQLEGGHLFDTSKVQYPQNIVQGSSATHNKDDVFVSILSTDDETPQTFPLNNKVTHKNDNDGGDVVSPYQNWGTAQEPNYIDWKPVGQTGYAYEIHKLTTTLKKSSTTTTANNNDDEPTVPDVLDKQWVQTFRSISTDGTQPHLQITSMIQLQNKDNNNDKAEQLVVTGYTNGHGAAVGGLVPSLTKNMNGFVTFVETSKGMLEKSIKLESTHEQDDYVTGICQDDQHVYVVGYTKGTLRSNTNTPYYQKRDVVEARSSSSSSSSPPTKRTDDMFEAFVQCIDLQTFTPTWTQQIKSMDSAKGHIYGMSCTVSDAGKVYVAGNVDAGALVHGIPEEDTKGRGPPHNNNTDIFVAQFDAVKGGTPPQFVRQVGSKHYNDYLAPKGGLLVDPHTDNVLVYGSTQGSFQRTKMTTRERGISDIFLMSLSSQDGSSKVSMDVQEKDETVVVPPPSPPVVVVVVEEEEPPSQDKDDTSNGVPPPPVTTTTTTTTTKAPDQNKEDDTKSHHHGFWMKIWGKHSTPMLVGLGCVCLLAVGCVAYRELSNLQFELSYYDNDEIDPISQYLAAFEFGDVEIKHSASGGYHAIYTDPELAEQTVGGTSEVAYRAEPYLYTSDHDRRVEDALFIDDYEPRNRFSMSGHFKNVNHLSISEHTDEGSMILDGVGGVDGGGEAGSDIMANYDERMDLFMEPQIHRPRRSVSGGSAGSGSGSGSRRGANKAWLEVYQRESRSFQDLNPFPHEIPKHKNFETKSEGGSINSITGLSEEQNNNDDPDDNNNNSKSSDSKQTESTDEDWGQDIC